MKHNHIKNQKVRLYNLVVLYYTITLSRKNNCRITKKSQKSKSKKKFIYIY